MLEVTSLEVRYGQVVALRGLDISIGAGETIAVVGPNGAGKTTLLRTISGLIRPHKGTITLDGRSIVGTSTHRLARKGLAHVPEGRAIFAPLTVEENLRMGGVDMSASAQDERMEELIELFPVLGERSDSPGGLLSGGEQQMLAIARGLMSRPRLLMIDEPSMGLAPKIVDDVLTALTQIVESGTSLLVSEQNASAALDVAGRAYVLVSGDVVESGRSSDLEEGLLEAYLA